MAMVCPNCNGSFPQRWHCPSCNVRLVFQATPAGHEAPTAAAGSQWQQTPWGRIVVGVVLSQGLYYGLRQLFNAGLAASGDAAGDVWSTLAGLLTLQALQAVGLLVAGGLAGAGQRQGLVFGAVVGVWNGVLTVALQGAGHSPTIVAMLGQPILHTAFGALGGFISSRIWKPLPTLELPMAPRAPQAPQQLKPVRLRSPLFAGPIAWGRMFMGAALAVGGTIWANVILELVLDASEGSLSITTHLQAQLVTWEVTALAMLAGSSVAGAGTSNSLKQGLCVGLLTAVVLTGFRSGFQHAGLAELVLTGASSLSLGLAGAWFGGSLFPPIVATRKPRGLGPESA